ncbi:cation/H(+) antiporter 2-like isoform X2 [Durio zibethinus]|uniref:Cation/H(+) antiporter 2-like isoform X2 n=1 Tax=Durio zibethinus TaxID=66656 RepID=A0A6P5XN53_DURZI|nr:cation/H(+) antiporter 2-like isoform X2 [Durio zibethinus]
MDIMHKRWCLNNYSFNPLVTSLMQTSCILAISHFFHLLLKPVGQPGPVAQVLAGAVLGPSSLSRIEDIREFFIQPTSAGYYQFFSHLFEIMFMFLIGLETDISFSNRNLSVASIIAYSGFILNCILGAALSPLFIKLLKIPDKKVEFAIVVMMILANSASPVVIRLVADLKLDTSDVGRLAATTSLVNEMSCVLIASLLYAVSSWESFSYLFLSFLLTGSLIALNRHLARWINKSDRESKYVSNAYVSFIFFLILVLSFVIESCGYSSTLSCFLVGLMFPRKGKTCRTLLSKLSYPVHNFLLPIYFGYIGFQFDINYLKSIPTIVTIVVMILLNFGGKLVSTLAACHYLKIPLNEGVMFALILSLKGHFDLQLINVPPNSVLWWNPGVRSVLLSIVVFDTIIAGIIVAFTVKREEKSLAHKQTSLELHDLESELRILACVYFPRHSLGALGLISALSGSKRAIVTPYLMHLVELPEKRKTNLLYHQLAEGDQYSDEDDYGGDDVVEINDAVDVFTSETKILINIVKVVSSSATLYEDVCTGAEDRRISIIFLPFHKHQRIDGNMEIDKEGIRTTNQRVLRHAPCSLGILVDRTVTGFQQPHCSNSVQHIAILFFGGPDDREALACSKWISSHPQVKLTLIRFLQVSEQISRNHNQDNEVMLAEPTNGTEHVIDNTSLVEFYNRYITSGQANYTEKHVSSGAETVTALRELRDSYSLFMVGRGGQRHSSITTLSDWEECPELGTVGDFLASSDFNTNASILVIQKHQHTTDNSFRGDY